MLRQALDAAQQQEEQSSRSPLISSNNEQDGNGRMTERGHYGAIHQNNNNNNNNNNSNNNDDDDDEEDDYQGSVYDDEDDDDDDNDDDEDDDDEQYMLNVWQDSSPPVPEMSVLERMWETMKSCFMLVVNVENLWDSPTTSQGREISRRNHCVVLFWFFILAVSYTGERTAFKLLVDQTGPFRLFSVAVATFTHALMVGLGMFTSAVTRNDFSMPPLGIPVVDVGLMALLDTVHMLLVFLTGYHVAPTLTVILVQFTLPLTALISQFVHHDGYFKRWCGGGQRRQLSDSNNEATTTSTTTTTTTTTMVHPNTVVQGHDNNVGQPFPGSGGLSVEHITGSIIISLAVLLALSPSIYTLIDQEFFIYADAIPMQTACNSILFVSSCIPAAASQIYKEHIFLQYKQPVQPDYLNLVLSIFQFIFASIMSPLVYTLLGFAASDDWTSLYPSSEFSTNLMDGWACYVGTLDVDRQQNGYADDATCTHVLWLVGLYAFSVIAVGVAVDKIVNAGATKVMYRGVSAGIILAVISLYIYDEHIPDFNYGAAIDSLNLVCLLLLVVGSEIYHRVSLQDATFETVYPEIDAYIDDDDNNDGAIVDE